ncbi:hypothetical protein HaLaN_09535 [Haematococcus lacustris]|uniref:Uncharacterized protein n=1 Tax=Haematococcus lacustris TaxID=44745 RepID=A0A699YUY5_HAELA|nr:hypothetical protein HaLaN_09535 [Haematococcus lacustris]
MGPSQANISRFLAGSAGNKEQQKLVSPLQAPARQAGKTKSARKRRKSKEAGSLLTKTPTTPDDKLHLDNMLPLSGTLPYLHCTAAGNISSGENHAHTSKCVSNTPAQLILNRAPPQASDAEEAPPAKPVTTDTKAVANSSDGAKQALIQSIQATRCSNSLTVVQAMSKKATQLSSSASGHGKQKSSKTNQLTSKRECCSLADMCNAKGGMIRARHADPGVDASGDQPARASGPSKTWSQRAVLCLHVRKHQHQSLAAWLWIASHCLMPFQPGTA